jgi:SAM-dependent methyltransferase
LSFLALDGSEFLRAWHARYPGASSAAFGYGRVGDAGVSSYSLLVDDVAALRDVRTVVDIACGDGHLLALLAARLPSAQVIGVDMSPEELNAARARRLSENVQLVSARADALPSGDASVDAVVCHMALMLFDDARSVVDELARVIRPGGILAAVLGPASGNSELFARFIAMLREVEVAEQLPRLRVGDPATFADDSLRALFADDAWSEVSVERFGLRLDGTDEQIQTSLLGMYNIARLSDEGRAELASRLKAEMTERHEAGRSTECVLVLRHLVAVRAA